MEKIYQHVEDIVTVAELQDGFYEVEVTVLVRRSGGSESDFIACNLKVTMERRSVDSSQSRVAVILECNGFKELKLSRHIDY